MWLSAIFIFTPNLRSAFFHSESLYAFANSHMYDFLIKRDKIMRIMNRAPENSIWVKKSLFFFSFLSFLVIVVIIFFFSLIFFLLPDRVPIND